MENASKALLMAGGILISIVIVSWLLIMANNLSDYQQVQTQSQREDQIIRFNNQYEGYVGREVRGNEMYSLVNKVIDFNKRKSELGNEGTETGINYMYKPMQLEINGLQANNTMFTMDVENNTESVLFKNDIKITGKIGIDDTINLVEKIKEIENKVLPDGNKVEAGDTAVTGLNYTEKILEKLVNSYETLFNYKDVNDFKERYDYDSQKLLKKRKVFEEFNKIVGGVEDYFKINNGNNSISDTDLNNLWKDYLSKDASNKSIAADGTTTQNIWHDVNTYFEYIQFKKALFKCDNVAYDPDSGRIIKMEFSFTGKFD